MNKDSKGQKNKPIVLYDGECRFCTISKNIAEKNTDNAYKFVSYHSDNGRRLSDKYEINPEKSIYILDDYSIKSKATASISILKKMKWWGRIIAYFFELLPRKFSDSVYDMVAKHRR